MSLNLIDFDKVIDEIDLYSNESGMAKVKFTRERLRNWRDRLKRVADELRKGRFQYFDRQVVDEGDQ